MIGVRSVCGMPEGVIETKSRYETCSARLPALEAQNFGCQSVGRTFTAEADIGGVERHAFALVTGSFGGDGAAHGAHR